MCSVAGCGGSGDGRVVSRVVAAVTQTHAGALAVRPVPAGGLHRLLVVCEDVYTCDGFVVGCVHGHCVRCGECWRLRLSDTPFDLIFAFHVLFSFVALIWFRLVSFGFAWFLNGGNDGDGWGEETATTDVVACLLHIAPPSTAATTTVTAVTGPTHRPRNFISLMVDAPLCTPPRLFLSHSNRSGLRHTDRQEERAT